MNANLFPLLLLGATLSGPASAQEPSPDLKSALAPLSRFAGNWEKRFPIYKSEWSPKEQVKTGTHSCKWILDERHLQETGRDADGSTYMSVYSYDVTAKAYRVTVSTVGWGKNGKRSRIRAIGILPHLTGF